MGIDFDDHSNELEVKDDDNGYVGDYESDYQDSMHRLEPFEKSVQNITS